MYSAFKPLEADSLEDAQGRAEWMCHGLAYRGAHGPVKAVEWPPTTQASKDWLAKHVGV